jgi:hypothetical protein
MQSIQNVKLVEKDISLMNKQAPVKPVVHYVPHVQANKLAILAK